MLFSERLYAHNSKHIIFLHGFWGSGKNFRFICKPPLIANNFQCHLLDLRNHGKSFHHPSMTYKEMSDDVIRYADAQNINQFLLVGHSMGGKIGTYICDQHSDRLHGAIIMEAPPIRLTNVGGYALKIKSHNYKLAEYCDVKGKNRVDVMKTLYSAFPNDKDIVNLIGQNLSYQNKESPDLHWISNVPALIANMETILDFDENIVCPSTKVAIINGEKSLQFGYDVFKRVFPMLRREHYFVLPGADHWVHADKPKETVNAMGSFIKYAMGIS